MKTYITTLGCAKNLVDSEASVSLLKRAGCSMTNDPNEADILIVSACSFLDAAWQETVDEVERMGRLKAVDQSKRIVLMGCLPKHRQENLAGELPFVDRFVPAGAHAQLPILVSEWSGGAALAADAAPDRFAGFEDRMLLTPPHTAYVKIAEGCSRRCSFCAIPQIRGKMVSRTVDSVVREIENMVQHGVKEVSLLAQDITSYHAQGKRFADLVDAITKTGIQWIRIFYVHPGSLTMDLTRRIFEHPAVCRYLEAPVQHASDRILKRMGRPYTRSRLERVLGGIHAEFPDVRIRSEVIVGFPGESDEDFDELKRFVESMEFASLGIFTYSPEANTRAAALDQAVPRSVQSDRAAELDELQSAIGFGLHCAEKGKRHRVLVDRKRDPGDDGDFAYAGRYYGQALEVDGEVLLKGEHLAVGEFVDARIIDGDVFDLHAEVG